jgi:peptide/nickel transport system ATP-binding protein
VLGGDGGGGLVTLLEVTDLVVRYGRGAHAMTAVDRVSFAVPAGTTLGIVGESGCGKSTIARSLVGLAAVAGGRIGVDGEDCTDERIRTSKRYRRRVQMVFQDPHSSLNPRMPAGRMLGDALEMREPRLRGRAERMQEIERLLDLVGLPASAAARYPHQFSGGQKQRLAIARALAVGADLIVHDEVTSALDVSVQATILNLLRGLQREFGLTYLFISHDLSVVRAMSDLVAVMYLGRIVELAPTDDIFAEPCHPYTRALFDSLPSLGNERRPAPLAGELPDPRKPPAGCRFHTRCPVGPLTDPDRSVCIDADPTEDAGRRSHQSACHFAPEGVPAPLGPARVTVVSRSAS